MADNKKQIKDWAFLVDITPLEGYVPSDDF
jgi:hypothetical protein